MKQKTVLQAKRLGIEGCSADDRLGPIARRMADDDISALVVVDDEGFLRGIITRSDLLRAYANDRQWKAKPVGDYMTSDVITVGPETSLSDVVATLTARNVHRLVVVRQEMGKERPIAVISDSDLVCDMADDL
ncbi:MAG: CBS domain-containing protein [Chloroflexota bacterium]|nr:CBS domain-containing protein [Chloroflexota bacterium]